MNYALERRADGYYVSRDTEAAHKGYQAARSQDRALILALMEEYKQVVEVLERIRRWRGEFPPTGKFWDDDKERPMSYAAAYGSNGERDYMRQLANEALTRANPVLEMMEKVK